MRLKELQSHWDLFARQDPLFAVVSWPEKKGGRWKEADFFRNGRDEVRGVMRYLAGLPVRVKRGRLLDFGCGVGRLTQAFASGFRLVTGVDVSPRMIELARRYNRHPRRCEYVLNEARDLKAFRNRTFDAVYCNITLQHMRPGLMEGYLREFVRVLRPGGIALFQIPDRHRPATATRRLKRAVKSVVPDLCMGPVRDLRRRLGRPSIEMNCLPRERVVRVLEGAGARMIDVREDPNAGPEWPGYRYCAQRRT